MGQDVAESIDGSERVELNTWIVDEETGERTMYSRQQEVRFCENHEFNKNHECGRCPYKFVGFRANLHIQTDEGIFERKRDDDSSFVQGKRLA